MESNSIKYIPIAMLFKLKKVKKTSFNSFVGFVAYGNHKSRVFKTLKGKLQHRYSPSGGNNNLKIRVGKGCWLPAIVVAADAAAVGCTNADATTLFLPLGRWEQNPTFTFTSTDPTRPDHGDGDGDDLVRIFVAHALFKVSCINIFIYCATHSHTLRAEARDAIR